jgi:hypothetical protein
MDVEVRRRLGKGARPMITKIHSCAVIRHLENRLRSVVARRSCLSSWLKLGLLCEYFLDRRGNHGYVFGSRRFPKGIESAEGRFVTNVSERIWVCQ